MDHLGEEGRIALSSIEVDSRCRLDHVRRTLGSFMASEELVNGWPSILLRKVTVGDQLFNARLLFSPEGKLSFVSLTYLLDGEELRWETWDDEREKERSMRQASFLKSLLGDPPYSYPWGEVVCEPNPRGGGPSITIRYE